MVISLRRGGAMLAADETGAELVSYIRDGTEYIWDGDPAVWSGHAPVLFPIVGGLKDETVRIGGRECHMKRHGFARRSRFARLPSAEGSLAFELRPTAQTLAQYPFSFRLRVTHTLMPEGFATAYEVANEDTRPMLFALGGHQSIRCPLRAGEDFSDYEAVFFEPEDRRAMVLDKAGLVSPGRRVTVLAEDGRTLPLRYDTFDGDALIFPRLRSRGVTLRSRRTGAGAAMEFTGFCDFGIWTPAGRRAPFVCLEPWQGMAAVAGETGNFEDKPDIVTLAPGAVYRAGYRVDVTP